MKIYLECIAVIAQPHFQKPSLILLDSRQTGVWFALTGRVQAFENFI
jgi:hypothetical protein